MNAVVIMLETLPAGMMVYYRKNGLVYFAYAKDEVAITAVKEGLAQGHIYSLRNTKEWYI